MSSVGMDFHNVVLPVIVSNGLGSFIKYPLSMSGMTLDPSSEIDPGITMHGNNSSHWHS